MKITVIKSAHFTITYSIECSISSRISTFNTHNLQNTACNAKKTLKMIKSAHFTITYSIECSISAHISTFNTRNLQNTACNGKKTLKVLKVIVSLLHIM